MDELTDAGTEAARQALAAERLRSARVLGLLRFVGISIACALNLLLPEVLHETRALQADIRLFACYWLVAAAVFWANRRFLPRPQRCRRAPPPGAARPLLLAAGG